LNNYLKKLIEINKNTYYLLLLLLILINLLFFNDIIYAENNKWDIKGQLINGTTNSYVEDHLIILHVSSDGELEEYSTKSDNLGYFHFKSLNYADDSVIGVSSIFEGVLYGKDLGLISNQNDEILLTVFKASDNSENITLENSTVMFTSVDKSKNLIWVMELIKVVNNSKTTFKPPSDNPMGMIRFGLPANYEDLIIDSDLLGVEFIVIDKGFAVLGNVYPGEHQILFTYGIKYDEQEYIYIRNLQFDLNNLRIITENNLNIELPDFSYDQNETFVNEIKYNLIEMNNFKQGEKIKIIFSDLPQATIFDKSKNYIQNFDRGWGMFILFFISLIISLPILLGKKRRIKS
tara:strand:+ start:2632 stop:3675 length:1044 start_codon:yes stop_codon:yes gene_type:complete